MYTCVSIETILVSEYMQERFCQNHFLKYSMHNLDSASGFMSSKRKVAGVSVNFSVLSKGALRPAN